MELDAVRAGYDLGATLAAAHMHLTGSTWAHDDFLLCCARLAWESEGKAQLAQHRSRGRKGDDGATFVRAYEEAYRTFQG